MTERSGNARLRSELVDLVESSIHWLREWDIIKGFLPGCDEALVWINTYVNTASPNGHS